LVNFFTTADIDDEEDPRWKEFYGLDFETWLDIFLEYAIFLAEDGETASAYETVISASRANVFFHSKDRMFLIHVTWFGELQAPQPSSKYLS